MKTNEILKILYKIFKSRTKLTKEELCSYFVNSLEEVNYVLDKYYVYKNNNYILKRDYLISYVDVKKKRHVIYDRRVQIKLKENNIFFKDLVLYNKQTKKVVYIIDRFYENIEIKVNRSYKVSFYFETKELKEYNIRVLNYKDLKVGKIYKTKIDSIQNFNITLKIIEVIGNKGDFDLHINRLISKASFDRFFAKNVLKEAEELKNEDLTKKRLDLTSLYTITIDNPGAKDYDDAISIEKKNGIYFLYVHIADVANYVLDKSKIDIAARNRCFSIYPINKVIPMLPEKLSNDYCSLNKNGEKLTLSAIFKIDDNFNVMDFKLEETKVKVSHNLYYDEINFENNNFDNKLLNTLSLLKEIYNKIISSSLYKDKLMFFDVEPNFYFKDEKILSNYEKKESFGSKLIEALMIFTNYHVAKYCNNHDLRIPYRVHALPKEEKVFEVNDILTYLNFSNIKNKDIKMEISNALIKLKDYDYFEKMLISDTLLKSQSKAIYSLTPQEHFALGIRPYCHFTSPIRRYADLLVHRQIKNHINKKELLKEGFILYMTDIINERERRLSKLERNLDKAASILYVKDNKKKDYLGVITEVNNNGFFVKFKEGFEAYVPIKFLDDYFYYEPEYKRLYSDIGIEYNIGDMVEVRYLKSDLERLYLDFTVKA